MLAYTGRGKSGYLELMRQLYEQSQQEAAAETDDDLEAKLPAGATKLIEAHRAGHFIEIDRDRYKSYMRPRLCVSPDPVAADLIRVLDKRFGLPS